MSAIKHRYTGSLDGRWCFVQTAAGVCRRPGVEHEGYVPPTVPEPLTTEEVKESFQYGAVDDYSGDDFDAWLGRIKAQAWAEGHLAGNTFVALYDNPYKETSMSKMHTIGALRSVLAGLPQDAEVYIDNRRPTGLASYRGYYDHLAITRDEVENPATFRPERGASFEMGGGYGTYHPGIGDIEIKAEPTVADLIEALDLADGAVFEGYKGGQFAMDAGSQIWVSQYGDCDRLRIERIEDLPGRIDLWTQETDW